MATKMIRCFCVSLLLAAGAAGTFAQNTGSTAPTPTPAPTPSPWGGDFRFRYETYNNVYTLGHVGVHDRSYFRARLRLWETVNPLPGLTLFGRISAEPRNWLHTTSPSPGKGGEGKYGLFDNLYAKWTTTSAGTPVVLTVGRQDIQLGDQWLVTDGSPLDGSWTNHFDGARLTIDAKDIKTKFEVIAFNQQARVDDRLPVLGNSLDHAGASYTFQEQDETGLIVYASNKSIKNTQLDGYFIYKGDNKVTAKGDAADIYTLGGKLSGTPSAHWLYSVEGAYQWGRRNDSTFTPAKNLLALGQASRDIAAYGANAKLTYLLKDPLNNQFTLQAEYLSGDKPSTGKDEMFDVLWGRTPRISEVWAVAIGQETGRNAQYSNLFRIGPNWSIAPTKSMTVSLTYNWLFAPETTSTRVASSSTLFSRTSHSRGQMLQLVVKQKFTKSLSGLLLTEYCPMGDFYTHHDKMTFLRAEMLYAF